jgi:hypothetical protein
MARSVGWWAEPLMIGKPKPGLDVIARASLTPRVSTLHALIAWHFAAFAYPELRITSATPQSPYTRTPIAHASLSILPLPLPSNTHHGRQRETTLSGRLAAQRGSAGNQVAL